MHPIISIARRGLSGLGLKFTPFFIEKTFLQHPQADSLAALVAGFEAYRVATLSVKVALDQLSGMVFPAVVLYKQAFVLVEACTKDSVQYFEPQKGLSVCSLATFGQDWDGIILLLSADANSQEPLYANNQKKHLKDQIQTSVMVLGVLFLLGAGAWGAGLLFGAYLSAWIGFLASLALVFQDFGQVPVFIQKFCGIGPKANCQSLGQSSVGQIWGYSWAEIGLCFFGAVATTLAFDNNAFIVSTLALPYVLFSVYYQGVVAKVWCRLCLVAMAALLAMFSFEYAHYQSKDGFALSEAVLHDLFVFGLSFVVLAGVWLFIKPLLKTQKKSKTLAKQLTHYQYDTDLLKALLAQQPSVEIGTMPQEIRLGNPDAPLQITMVSNPFCGPCGQVHQLLADWVAFYADETQLIIRWTGNSPEQQQVIKHLLGIKMEGKEGKDGFAQSEAVLHDWYAQKDYTLWAKQYPVTNIEGMTQAYQAQQNWANDVGIAFTPTIFINDKQWPVQLNIEDLGKHIKTLANLQF